MKARERVGEALVGCLMAPVVLVASLLLAVAALLAGPRCLREERGCGGCEWRASCPHAESEADGGAGHPDEGYSPG